MKTAVVVTSLERVMCFVSQPTVLPTVCGQDAQKDRITAAIKQQLSKVARIDLYQAGDFVTNGGNQHLEAVLVKLFPCLVRQWVARAFDNNYSQL
jgi:hypothetical protein